MLKWLRRGDRGRAGGAGRRPRLGARDPRLGADVAHLEEFVRTRAGVEAYVEPRTAVTETTLLLIASSGEWTRRRVPDAQYAAKFAARQGVPFYDAVRVGYPQRMRDWTARRRAAEKAAERAARGID